MSTNALQLLYRPSGSPDAIASARRGQYPLSIRDSMSPERLARFFDRHESHYQIKSSLRDTVLFAQHDVVPDPPFTKLDLITCRNLLIYFDPMPQRRLMPRSDVLADLQGVAERVIPE